MLDKLAAALAGLPPVKHYLVAYSGGLDSTVLLHRMMRERKRRPIELTAVHVHHGLQDSADDWAGHCRRVCLDWSLPCQVVSAAAKPAPGQSPEAAAREARYAALRPLVTAGSCLLTAHHQDDQAETLLLQLLRGAGPAGLAAMPATSAFGEGIHARPLLAVSRRALRAYAETYGLAWIEDTSNRSIVPDRNYIRHRLLPAITARWPSAAATLARAGAHQTEALRLQGELGAQDRVAVCGARPDTLSVGALRRLSAARQRNVLRHWIAGRQLPLPTAAQLEQICSQVLTARGDSRCRVDWSGAEVRRYRDDLYAMEPLSAHDPGQRLDWRLEDPLVIPALGMTLTQAALERQGLVLPLGSRLEVRFRRGGERCRPRGRSYTRPLKKLLQEAGVPPWQRNRIPLLYAADRLVAVWDYWICACHPPRPQWA